MDFLKEILRPNLAITRKGYKKNDTALKVDSLHGHRGQGAEEGKE